MQIVPTNGELRVRLAGEVGFGDTEIIERAIEAAITKRPVCLYVDCDGLTFADSSFLRLLLQLDESLRSQGSTLKIINVSKNVSKLFVYTGLDSHFDWSEAETKP